MRNWRFEFEGKWQSTPSWRAKFPTGQHLLHFYYHAATVVGTLATLFSALHWRAGTCRPHPPRSTPGIMPGIDTLSASMRHAAMLMTVANFTGADSGRLTASRHCGDKHSPRPCPLRFPESESSVQKVRPATPRHAETVQGRPSPSTCWICKESRACNRATCYHHSGLHPRCLSRCTPR